MLSKGLKIYPNRVALLRLQSTSVTGVKNASPIAQLNYVLSEELSDQVGSRKIFDSFKAGMFDFDKNNGKSGFTLQRSFGLNTVLGQLLERSKADLKTNISTSVPTPPEPYEILIFMCDYGLARDSHFRIVFEHLVATKSPEDVLGFWVKYLETIAENPRTITYGSYHSKNIVLASIGYLLLAGDEPSCSVLTQVLRFDAEKEQIPFTKIRSKITRLPLSASAKKKALKNLDVCWFQFLQSDKSAFIRTIDELTHARDLNELFELYSSITGQQKQSLDCSIVAKFMDRFVSLGKPQQAINCYNKAKADDSLDLSIKNSLLLAVSAMPAFGRQAREEKLKRVEAVWNSLIKTHQETTDLTSYVALIKALHRINGFDEIKHFWNREIPNSLKKEPELLQEYLLTQFRRQNFKLSEVEGFLPEIITSLDLANAVLSKMIEERYGDSAISSFYKKQLTDSKFLKPNATTFAIKMFQNYLNSQNPDFSFLKSISKSKKDVASTNAIFQEFVNVCPDMKAINKLFDEIREPFDSRNYGIMIKALFAEGNATEAEKIFKDFATGTPSLNAINRFVLDPIVISFCELCIKEGTAGYLSKVLLYADVAKRAQRQLTFSAASKITHMAALLAKSKDKVMSQSDKDNLHDLLRIVSEIPDYTPSPRDMKVLKSQKEITLPASFQ
ncbi:LAMI_0F05622g1_1 [Lachancea mirantina]|uniref:LAMI_0F05622g1_1 n=1 Tax=Lachancea mirantina TaxID=1230905 RepID=A0A1G4JYF3_9SACH|nr:LAMI_0F05622g1_1 [Lachancea mirantina]